MAHDPPTSWGQVAHRRGWSSEWNVQRASPQRRASAAAWDVYVGKMDFPKWLSTGLARGIRAGSGPVPEPPDSQTAGRRLSVSTSCRIMRRTAAAKVIVATPPKARPLAVTSVPSFGAIRRPREVRGVALTAV